ncbi:MAG: aminotransferase class I/II-fold pyridoxal phosphate-dependent enzyme, partial [Planctomycetes bacterium]|nr:aminotransferase class I/II-fold pyridoxal phosphate-dependent enzyme [Planctomycetota bacterium]
MQVNFVDLKPQYLQIKSEIDAAIMGVVEEHAFVLGPQVQAFEEESAAYLGVKHAIGVSNGSDALYLALLALGVGPGDEVVTVPHTYIATPEAIHRVGAKIVFADVHPESWNLDPEKLKA